MRRLRTALAYVSVVILGSLALYRTLDEPTSWPQKLFGIAIIIFCLWYFTMGVSGSGPPDPGHSKTEQIKYYSFWLTGSVLIMIAAYSAPDVPTLGRLFLYCVSGVGIVTSLGFIVSGWRHKA
jgi:hypothetical protein